MTDEKKIPMPDVPEKVLLSAPITFWSNILLTLDKKTQFLKTNYGYGEVSLTIKIHNGKITEVNFNDEVKMRGLVEEAERLESFQDPSEPTPETK